jgi:pyrimidine-specific ribonucleoside hydrolase
MTVIDRYQFTGKPANATVLFDIDRQGFVDFIVERLHAYD